MGINIYTRNEEEKQKALDLLNDIKYIIYKKTKTKPENIEILIKALECYLERLKSEEQQK